MAWLARVGLKGWLFVLAGLVGLGVALGSGAGGGAVGAAFAATAPPPPPPPPAFTSVSGVTSASSSSAAGAMCVTYAIRFTTSSTGALAANNGTVTIVAPAGTVFPSDPSAYLFQDSTASFGASVVLSNGGATATLTVLGTVGSSDSVTLTISCVTNPAPAATGLTLTLTTSSDVFPTQSPTYATTPPQPLSGVTPVLLSSHVAGATCVTYALGFAASSTGGLVANRGSVRLAGPAGIVFPSDRSLYAFHDSSTNSNFGALPAVQDGGSTVAMTVGGLVRPGDSLTLTIKCVKNPSARTTNDDLAVSSTSDIVGVGTPSFEINGQPPPPAPRNGHSVDVFVVSGEVLVKLPGQKTFTVLSAGEQIPVGTTVDVTHGRVRLESAKPGSGALQVADFYGGVFVVGQHHGQSLTTLKLSGGNFASCRSNAASDLAGPVARTAGRRPRRHVWGNGHGNFKTTGNSASATVRGTIWLTQDDCEGTLVRVTRDVVSVRDFVRNKTILVHAGHSYFASNNK